MGDLQLSAGSQAAISARHESAAKAITDLADSVPTSVDAGYGTAAILEIIAAVVSTADDIALVNEVAAAQVDAVGADFGATDDAVHDNFRDLEVVVR